MARQAVILYFLGSHAKCTVDQTANGTADGRTNGASNDGADGRARDGGDVLVAKGCVLAADGRANAVTGQSAARIRCRSAQRTRRRHERRACLIQNACGVVDQPSANVLRGKCHLVAQHGKTANDVVINAFDGANHAQRRTGSTGSLSARHAKR